MDNPSKSPAKYSYKITNWKDYNESLKKRGQIRIWFSSKLLSIWKNLDVRKITVGEQMYPDAIIEFCLTMKNLYHLPLRQTTGFVEDLLTFHGCIGYCVPNYSTLSRRAGQLSVEFSQQNKWQKGVHLLVDSTGIKVYGDGEWLVKKHGVSKHRTWLKLHLCLNATTQEIMFMSLTSNSIDDANAAKPLLQTCPFPVLSLRADGAYDKFLFREILGDEVVQKIPPPCNAVVQVATKKEPVPTYLIQRNQAVERIKEIGSKEWKKEIGYHQRSLIETTMFRYKVIFGDKSTTRKQENQLTEAKIKCKILNKFTTIGMPKAVQIFKK